MASGAHTSGVQKMLDGTHPLLSSTIKVMLLAAGVYTYNPDDDVVDAGGASDVADAELNVSGYTPGHGSASRKTLASKTISVNDANNRVECDAADVSWIALGAGATIGAAEMVVEAGADDTATQLLNYLDPSDVPTNGSDVTLQFASNGFLNFNT